MYIEPSLDLFLSILIPIILTFISVVLGSFFASFSFRYINEISYKDEKYSFCDNCHHRLSSIDLIPIFSFLFLKGRCRYCKEKIPIYTFLFEILSLFFFLGLYFYGIYVLNDFVGSNYIPYIYVFDIFIAFFLFIGAYIDFKKYEVPYTILILIASFIVIEYIIKCIIYQDYLLVNLIGLIFPLALFTIIYLIYFYILKKEPIGLADVTCFAFIGLNIGIFNIVILLFISSMFAIIYYIYNQIKIRRYSKGVSSNKKENNKKDNDDLSSYEEEVIYNNNALPFFPFIALAYFVIFFIKDFINEEIISYLSDFINFY